MAKKDMKKVLAWQCACVELPRPHRDQLTPNTTSSTGEAALRTTSSPSTCFSGDEPAKNGANGAANGAEIGANGAKAIRD